MIKQMVNHFLKNFIPSLIILKKSKGIALIFSYRSQLKKLNPLWNRIEKIPTKWILTAVATALVCLLTTSDIFYFLNATKVKGHLQKQISSFTQQNFTIDGPVQWHFNRYPYLEASNLTLNSPTPFSQNLMLVKKARLFPHFWPLFIGKIVFDVELSDVSINLEQMASGYSNWQSLSEQLASLPSSAYAPLGNFIFSKLTIHTGKITLLDEGSHRQYAFHTLNLSAAPLKRALKGQLTPIALQFNVEDSNLGLLGNCSIQTSYRFAKGLDKIEVQNFVLKTQFPNNIETKLAGNFEIHHLKTSPEIQGSIELKNFDLATWLDKFEINHPLTLPNTAELIAKFNYKDSWLDIPNFTLSLRNQGILEGSFKLMPSFNLRMIDGEGTILSKTLTLNNMEMKQLKASVLMKDGVMDITPFEFQLAKGRHHGSIHVEYNSLITKLNLNYSGENFELDTLLKSMGNTKMLEGKTWLKAALSSRGTTIEQLRKNLAGQTELEINNGHVYGVDLLYLLKHAQSSVKSLIYTAHNKQPSRVNHILSAELKEWQDQARSAHPFFTPFDSIKASALITKGVLNNPDLIVQHPQYTIEGKGTLNLNQDSLQYRLFAHYKEPALDTSTEIVNFLKSMPLGIHITGVLGNPAVNPDLNAYTQNGLKFSQKHLSEKFSEKTLDKYIDDVSS